MVKQGKVAGQVLGTAEIQVENITSTANEGVSIDFKKYGHVIYGRVVVSGTGLTLGGSWVTLGSIPQQYALSTGNIIVPGASGSDASSRVQVCLLPDGTIMARNQTSSSDKSMGSWYSGYFSYII